MNEHIHETISANQAFLEQCFRNAFLLLLVSVILFTGGLYLFKVDFWGNYGGVFSPRKDGRGAAIVLGVIGLYAGYVMMSRWQELNRQKNAFITVLDKGLKCYFSEWTVSWNNLRSIKWIAPKECIRFELHSPISYKDILGLKSKPSIVDASIKHLTITPAEAEEFVARVSSLIVINSPLPQKSAK